jgi:hypothetical protein
VTGKSFPGWFLFTLDWYGLPITVPAVHPAKPTSKMRKSSDERKGKKFRLHRRRDRGRVRGGETVIPHTVAMALTLASILTITSCSGDEPPSTGSATTPPGKLPTRPREINMNGLNSCDLLTNEQQKQLLLDRSPRISTQLDPLGNKSCSYQRDAEPTFDFLVTAIPQEGVDRWLPGKLVAQSSIIQIADFSAVQVQQTAENQPCSYYVDVAEGQSLEVRASPVSRKLTTKKMCEKGKKATELILMNLRDNS